MHLWGKKRDQHRRHVSWLHRYMESSDSRTNWITGKRPRRLCPLLLARCVQVDGKPKELLQGKSRTTPQTIQQHHNYTSHHHGNSSKHKEVHQTKNINNHTIYYNRIHNNRIYNNTTANDNARKRYSAAKTLLRGGGGQQGNVVERHMRLSQPHDPLPVHSSWFCRMDL